MHRISNVLGLIWLTFGGSLSAAEVRFNEIQVIGTHNSYHIAPEPAMARLIDQSRPGASQSIDYTHRPLWEQFALLGVRQIELDVFADPEGGHYAQPKGRGLAEAAGLGPLMPHDSDGKLLEPGLKVLHVTDFDYRTRVYTFVDALRQIRTWSEANPQHVPLTVLVEVKQSADRPLMTSPIPFDAEQLKEIDREIRSVFSEEQLITPDFVRGDSPTLRGAITQRGWPLLDAVRGRVLFALDNGGAIRDRYLEGNETLEGRVLFASVDAEHPAAAFMKINNPDGDFEKIQAAVKAGFIVRTRADSPTRHARENDRSQLERAFASGAQFVSTDYPEPDRRLSEYQVRFPSGVVARTNPLIGEVALRGEDLDGVQRWETLDRFGGERGWYNPYAWGDLARIDDELVLKSERNFMVTTKTRYRDFIFELEARVPEGNSGVFFRCQLGDKKLLGYQAEIDRSERQFTGGVYDNTGRGFLVPPVDDGGDLDAFRERQSSRPLNEGWNRVRVECFGNRIRVAVNGRWISDFEDDWHRSGFIGLQHHGNASEYRFRNLRILPLN